jgi:hypothetical protein
MSEVGETRSTPLDTGPGHYERLRIWCRANGHDVGPNGFVSAAACVAFKQAEIYRRAGERIEPTR